MSGCIKSFDYCGKNMSFLIEEDVYLQYTEIWNKINFIVKQLCNTKVYQEVNNSENILSKQK